MGRRTAAPGRLGKGAPHAPGGQAAGGRGTRLRVRSLPCGGAPQGCCQGDVPAGCLKGWIVEEGSAPTGAVCVRPAPPLQRTPPCNTTGNAGRGIMNGSVPAEAGRGGDHDWAEGGMRRTGTAGGGSP